MSVIQFQKNKFKNNQHNEVSALFNLENVAKVYNFHKSMGTLYNVTPLVRLKELAKYLGVKDIFVKDESKRGTIKAFKLLGGAYSVASAIAKKLNKDLNTINFEYLKSRKVKEKLGQLVFAAASDGNHGKSVAWAAREFNQKSIVYMPKGTVKDRIQAIEQLGGEVIVTEMNYDGCVSTVNSLGKKNGWEVILDTATEGNVEVATWVMQGYSTMAYETYQQLNAMNISPTHVFTQAGVGSMAAATMGVWINHLAKLPMFYTLEPKQASCYFLSGQSVSGEAVSVTGDMNSISAGLACGVPNPIAWKLIKNFADGFLASEDYLTANGMRILGNPLLGDEKIVAGESAAIGMGVLMEILLNQENLRQQLNLDSKSVIVLYSTEGDTDVANYREIVWEGKLNKLRSVKENGL